MRQRTPLLVALILIVGGLGAAGSAMGHTASPTADNQYEITDQGVLTGYGGPIPSPLGGHVQNPVAGENLFVPCGSQGVNTAGPGGEHHHVGSCVSYAVQVKGDGGGTSQSEIEAEVDYDRASSPIPPPTGSPPGTADLDLYLYGPGGDIVPGTGNEGGDSGRLTISEGDLPQGSYTVLLVARHGVAPYDTTITVTD